MDKVELNQAKEASSHVLTLLDEAQKNWAVQKTGACWIFSVEDFCPA